MCKKKVCSVWFFRLISRKCNCRKFSPHWQHLVCTYFLGHTHFYCQEGIFYLMRGFANFTCLFVSSFYLLVFCYLRFIIRWIMHSFIGEMFKNIYLLHICWRKCVTDAFTGRERELIRLCKNNLWWLLSDTNVNKLYKSQHDMNDMKPLFTVYSPCNLSPYIAKIRQV